MNYSEMVSVVIPVFNGENYLHQAIDSVLTQTHRAFELLVVDDGSTDGTWRIIEAYGSKVRGFRKRNGGVASALNLGIRESVGRWFAWLSHDDLFLPMKLETQVRFLKQSPRWDGCYTGFYVIDAMGRAVRVYDPPWYPRSQALRELFRTTYVNGSTVLVDRRCFGLVGLFDERLRHTQDVDMWMRLVERCDLGRIPEPLVRWRSHEAQGSRNTAGQEAEEREFFSRMYDDLGPARLFPEQARRGFAGRSLSRCHEWMGDTMLVHRRGWYNLASRRYRQAITAWPVWWNPARPKLVAVRIAGAVIPCLRREVRRVRRSVPRKAEE